MSKKTKRTASFKIDGRISHQITKKDKTGKKEWTKYQAQKDGQIQITPHIYKDSTKSHMDVYRNGDKIKVIPDPKLRSPGSILNVNTLESTELPPILITKDELNTSDEIERARSYVKRMKLIDFGSEKSSKKRLTLG